MLGHHTVLASFGQLHLAPIATTTGCSRDAPLLWFESASRRVRAQWRLARRGLGCSVPPTEPTRIPGLRGSEAAICIPGEEWINGYANASRTIKLKVLRLCADARRSRLLRLATKAERSHCIPAKPQKLLAHQHPTPADIETPNSLKISYYVRNTGLTNEEDHCCALVVTACQASRASPNP